MEKKIISFLILICIHISTSTVGGSKKSIIILAGQSNMSGRGGVMANGTWDQVVPPECQSNPLISRLNAAMQWEEAREPLHEGIDTKSGTVGVGPGMPFATSVLDKYGEIGLVPCAIGGTYITQWARGGQLYNSLLTRTQAAIKLGGCLRGMLWYQGENDANSPDDAALYKPRFEQFVKDVRSDLRAPLLPVVEVALASGGTPEWREIVRKGQFESAEEVAKVRCVDAKGLERKQFDMVHLTTHAQVKLGRFMADAFLTISAPLPCIL